MRHLTCAILCLLILASLPVAAGATRLAKDTGAGIYVVQQTGDYGEIDNVDVLLAYGNADTKTGWVRSWGRPADEFLASITSDNLGNALICGRYKITTWDEYVASPGFILKFSNTGNLLWAKDLHWSDHSLMLNDIASDSAGNVYVTGNAWKYDDVAQTGGWHALLGFIFTAKLDSNGEVLWARRWKQSQMGNPMGVAVVSNGSQVVTAGYFTNSANDYNSDMVLLWYDTNGNLTQTTSYGMSSDTWVRPVEMTYDPTGSNIYIAGWNSGDTDVVLFKYSSGGFLNFAQAWGNSDLNNANDICTIGDSVFIAGSQQTGTAPADDTGYERPLFDGLVLEYAADVLVDQVTCVDEATDDDTVFNSVIAQTYEKVYVFGAGPMDDEQALYPEAEGVSWYLQGTTGSPTAWEEENCGSNSFDIEVTAVEPMSFETYRTTYCDNRRLFIGRMNWGLGQGVGPDTRLTADKTSGPAPLTVNFSSAATTIVEGAIANYSWDMDIDNGLDFDIDTGLTPTYQYTFTEPGLYNVAVNVTSDDGTEMPATIQIRVT